MIPKLYKNGFSFLEVIIVVAIVLIIISISISSFSSSGRRQALDKSEILALSILNEARSLAVSGKNSLKHGVHIEGDRFVLFAGESYVEDNEDNIEYELSKFVEIKPADVSISGGSNIIFEKNTGQTSNVGFFRISLKDDGSASSTISISNMGIFKTQ